MVGFEEDLDGPETEAAKWLKRIGTTLFFILLLAGVWMVVKSLMYGQPGKRKSATSVRIVVPDLPPPPPPREQPNEQQKEIKIDQPKPQEAPQPAAEVLKMEGAAGNGASPFAAGTVNKDYIGGKVEPGAYRWYTDQIKARIEEAIAAQKDLDRVQYRLIVHVWLARDGRVERAELQGSTGDKAIDKLIRKALTGMGSIAEAPPADMPQPVKLRITSKNAG